MKKIFKRCTNIWWAHISSVIILLILSVPIIAFLKKDIYFTVGATIIYIMAIYSAGWNEGFRDSRNVGESVPDIPLAFRAVLFSCIIPFILLVLRVIAFHAYPSVWRPYGAGHEMILTSSPFLIVTDIIYRLYNYYFISFMTGGTLISYIIPILIPIAVYPIGYRVGLTRFSIVEKYMPGLIYKPKKKRNGK